MLTMLCVYALVPCANAGARTLQARIARVATPVATLEDVRVRLHWPATATQGRLRLQARRVAAGDIGYRFRGLDWQCRLRRTPRDGWRCEGAITAPGRRPAQLAVHFDDAGADAALVQGQTRLALQRRNARPDLTRIDLTRVPVQWVQALAAQAWPEGRLGAGRLDGRLAIHAPRAAPLRIQGPLALAGVSLQSRDGTIVGEHLDSRLQVDYRTRRGHSQLDLRGTLAGELLFGETYLGLAGRPVQWSLQGSKQPRAGWHFPRFEWRDGETLLAHGSAAFAADGRLSTLDVEAGGSDAAPLRERYLSALLGRFGVGDVEISGSWRGRLRQQQGRLHLADLALDGVDLRDPRDRFALQGLSGQLVFSGAAPVASELRWQRARMYGLDFGAAVLPFESRDGTLALQREVGIPLFGGQLRVDGLRIVPPRAGSGLQMDFGLQIEEVDVGAMAKAFGLPEFRGRLNGQLPRARYADDLLTFDGGLSLGLFEGAMQITRLSMERPFGTAPTLGADIDFNDLDLLRLTEVFDFGSITGRLDGYIHGLRLVDWTPVQFDAAIVTDRKPGVRQRISQRAVQNISSVGDASFVSSLQGQLIGLFDDFGYRRLGIRCRLQNEVCAMGGLDDLDATHTPRSDSSGFTIVEGAGLPRLSVIGFNRRVDWPTLLERLQAVGRGDLKPVIE